MNLPEVTEEVVQYRVKRLRPSACPKGGRRKGRWIVVKLIQTSPQCVERYRMPMDPLCHDVALKVANTLNALNTLPEFKP